MIRFIVAIDTHRGMANEQGIPWQGQLPTDTHFYRDETEGHTMLMGYNTYLEYTKAPPKRRSVVAVAPGTPPLRPGFETVTDARKFLQETTEDIWVIGGAGMFTETLDLADELYITQLQAEFPCTKFFPEFHKQFELALESAPKTENGITFTMQIWRKKL